MRTIVVESEKQRLHSTVEMLEQMPEVGQVCSFSVAETALAYMKDHDVEIAFLDMEPEGMDGLTLAKEIKQRQPSCAVILMAESPDGAVESFRIRASGYLLKPVSQADLQAEVDYVKESSRYVRRNSGIRVQCFGHFEIFHEDVPLKFRYRKSKELFAYLIDRKGSAVSTTELCTILWEDQIITDSMKKQLRNLIADLSKALREVGEEDVFVKSRNSFAIAVNRIRCDYYGYLAGDVEYTNAFLGEYMTQYSWAETTMGLLEMKKKEMLAL